jgi:N-methylhydantoinase A/oxoprolinase/acetone carboxylase beta subunit
LDEPEIITICDQIKDTSVKAIAVVGVFSSLDPEGRQEKRVRDIIHRRLGSGIDVVISSDGTSQVFVIDDV